MNRRTLIGCGLGAAAIAVVNGRAVAGNIFTGREPLCGNDWCKSFLETATRENIEETKSWKAEVLRGRDNPHMLFTFYGCCGCEVSPPDVNGSEWTYKRRNLTAGERELFHAEYGRQASLLLTVEMKPGMKIRGFVLNGRRVGWNLSTAHA